MMRGIKTNAALEPQAEIFTRYLIGEKPTKKVTELFVRAITEQRTDLSMGDEKLLGFVLRHRWSLGFVDSGLAITRPHSEVRRRLYVMLAILEATPIYSTYFLARKRNPFYILVIGAVGIIAVLKTALGVVIIKVVH